MDAPAHLFVDELVAAYPEAKIVLTTRDVDSWIRSLENTFLVWLSWPFFNTICALEPVSIAHWYF
jgi:Sulfotransferase domain